MDRDPSAAGLDARYHHRIALADRRTGAGSCRLFEKTGLADCTHHSSGRTGLTARWTAPADGTSFPREFNMRRGREPIIARFPRCSPCRFGALCRHSRFRSWPAIRTSHRTCPRYLRRSIAAVSTSDRSATGALGTFRSASGIERGLRSGQKAAATRNPEDRSGDVALAESLPASPVAHRSLIRIDSPRMGSHCQNSVGARKYRMCA